MISIRSTNVRGSDDSTTSIENANIADESSIRILYESRNTEVLRETEFSLEIVLDCSVIADTVSLGVDLDPLKNGCRGTSGNGFTIANGKESADISSSRRAGGRTSENCSSEGLTSGSKVNVGNIVVVSSSSKGGWLENSLSSAGDTRTSEGDDLSSNSVCNKGDSLINGGSGSLSAVSQSVSCCDNSCGCVDNTSALIGDGDAIGHVVISDQSHEGELARVSLSTSGNTCSEAGAGTFAESRLKEAQPQNQQTYEQNFIQEHGWLMN